MRQLNFHLLSVIDQKEARKTGTVLSNRRNVSPYPVVVYNKALVRTSEDVDNHVRTANRTAWVVVLSRENLLHQYVWNVGCQKSIGDLPTISEELQDDGLHRQYHGVDVMPIELAGKENVVAGALSRGTLIPKGHVRDSSKF